MDAIRLLKDDHQQVKKLFRAYEEAGDRAHRTKQRLADEIFRELAVHTAIEEEIFYPAVAAKASTEGKELVSEGVEEHHVVDVLMAELKNLSPEDEQFDAKITVLIENVEHHIEEEEGEMLPEAKKKLSADLEPLGEQMLRRKEELVATQGVASSRMS